MAHPCLECGACCATWSVQFERSELTRALEPHVRRASTPRNVVLVGTEGESPRCAALEGEIGRRSTCAIYAIRPSPCREVEASLELGHRDESCDEARERHGLPPLTFADWR